MQLLKKKIASSISAVIAENFGTEQDLTLEILPMLEYPPDKQMGDLALPCFRFAKILRKAPAVIATQIAEKLNIPEIESTVAVNGYLNIKKVYSRLGMSQLSFAAYRVPCLSFFQNGYQTDANGGDSGYGKAEVEIKECIPSGAGNMRYFITACIL